MMDIADATIVSGVLDRLFDAGWVLVATCNRTPQEFAASELHQRHPQARFVRRIMEECDRTHLHSADADGEAGSSIDYRQKLRAAEEPTYMYPLDEPLTERALEARYAHALSGSAAVPTSARIGYGRSLAIEASLERGVARTSFDNLCATPLGAVDYIALAQQFHTLFVTGVPQLSLQERDKARRFITLVDQLYNVRTKLVVTAAVPLPHLFHGSSSPSARGGGFDFLEGLEFEGEAGKAAELNPIGVTANSIAPAAAASLSATANVGADSRKRLAKDTLFTGEDEIFAFRRALSRLREMQSIEYLARSGDQRAGVHSA